MKKGVGPRRLGVSKQTNRADVKSVALQTNTQDYRNLKPKDARTFADSAAVETGHFSNSGRAMGEIVGKVASGGTFTGSGFTQGNTPNSPKAKQTLKETRDLAKKNGYNYKDVYK